jgi:hypothetical protein
VCTSLDEADRDRDIAALDELLASDSACAGVGRVTQLNPFASTMPELWSAREGEQSTVDRIGYSNAYWHVVAADVDQVLVVGATGE